MGRKGGLCVQKKLSLDSSSKIAVIKHALIESEKHYNKKFNFIVDLDVTSPLRKVEDIINAFKVFIKKKRGCTNNGSKIKKKSILQYCGVSKIIKCK